MNSAVLVLTWNGGETALRCLHSLAALDPAPAEIVVVDNGSHDDTADRVATSFPHVTLIRNAANLGFAGGMNTGLKALLTRPDPPEAIILLNQDTVVDQGWLGAILAPLAADATVGAVGCKIRYPDGTLQHAGGWLEPTRAVAHHLGMHEADMGQYDTPRSFAYLTFAAVALRVAALGSVGLFDEGYAPAYYEDVDLCWRLRRAGFALHYAPQATLIHQESLSLRDELTRSSHYNRGRLRFLLKSYPLDELLGPFAAAETAFLHEYAHYPEGRVLRYAYGETLAALPEIVALRRTLDPDLPAHAQARLHELLLGLRRTLTGVLYRRAIACADELYAL